MMAPDDQARDAEERGSPGGKADALSLSSFSSTSSSDDSLVTDGDDGGKAGHVNLVMSDLLNQPAPASVNITNSSDVRIGPSLHYNGPVTINQFLNLQQLDAAGLQDIPLPGARLSNGTGKGVLSGVGACAEAGKRAGGAGAPWWRRPALLAAAGALLVLLAAVATLVALLSPASGGGSRGTVANSTTTTVPVDTENITVTDPPPNPELILNNGQRIFSRKEWSDVLPIYTRPLHHPTPYVVIGHTAGPACSEKTRCFELLRNYRDQHKATLDQPDISYNFLIDVEGHVYEGRGWDATNNNQDFVKRCNLGVTFFGNFVHDNATDAMADSLQRLLQLGVSLGKLATDYRLLAHSQVFATLSPGTHVLNLIASWPNRCLSHCDQGVQCIDASFNQASTTPSSGNQTVGS